MQCGVHFTSVVLIASTSVQHKIMLETIQWSDIGVIRQFYLEVMLEMHGRIEHITCVGG